VNIQQLKFAEPGLYSVDVRLDDQSHASIPLLVKMIERPVACGEMSAVLSRTDISSAQTRHCGRLISGCPEGRWNGQATGRMAAQKNFPKINGASAIRCSPYTIWSVTRQSGGLVYQYHHCMKKKTALVGSK